MPISQDDLLGFYRNGDLQQFLHGIFDNWDTIDISFLEQLSKKILGEEILLGVRKLILQDYHAEKSDHDMCQETIIDVVEFVKKAKQANLSVRELRLSLHDLGHSRKKLYRYFSSEKAQEDEDRNQREVCERFFRTRQLLREGKRAQELLKLILENLATVTSRSGKFATAWSGYIIPIDSYSARSLIMALVKAMNSLSQFPTVRFQIGGTKIFCDGSPTELQQGNVWMYVDDLGTREHFSYGSGAVVAELQDIVGVGTDADVVRTRILAKLMREKTRVFSTFRIEEFNQTGEIKLDDEPAFAVTDRATADREAIHQAITTRIHYLNGLSFLRAVVEPARRLCRNTASISESDAMPIAILQARSNRLLAVGVLSVRDVYGDSAAADWEDGLIEDRYRWQRGHSPVKWYSHSRRAKYGVATGESTTLHVDIMRQKAAAINERTELAVTRSPDRISEYTDRLRLCEPAGFFQKVKAGRNYMRMELGEEYGSGSESDHSDYSDDSHP